MDKGESIGTVTLVSNDGVQYSIAWKSALVSGLLVEMIENEDDEHVIPLPNISSDMLLKVVSFCECYSAKPFDYIERPLRCGDLAKLVGEDYAKFVELDKKSLFSIIEASNYMDIRPLLELASARVALNIRGMCPDEIGEYFGLVNYN